MKEKILESILGLIFLIPAIISVYCFLVNLLSEGKMCDLRSLSGLWDYYGLSIIYVSIIALVGAYMLKNSSRYVFLWFSTKARENGTYRNENGSSFNQQRMSYLNRYK